jgi:hypothetical protein
MVTETLRRQPIPVTWRLSVFAGVTLLAAGSGLASRISNTKEICFQKKSL